MLFQIVNQHLYVIWMMPNWNNYLKYIYIVIVFPISPWQLLKTSDFYSDTFLISFTYIAVQRLITLDWDLQISEVGLS